MYLVLWGYKLVSASLTTTLWIQERIEKIGFDLTEAVWKNCNLRLSSDSIGIGLTLKKVSKNYFERAGRWTWTDCTAIQSALLISWHGIRNGKKGIRFGRVRSSICYPFRVIPPFHSFSTKKCDMNMNSRPRKLCSWWFMYVCFWPKKWKLPYFVFCTNEYMIYLWLYANFKHNIRRRRTSNEKHFRYTYIWFFYINNCMIWSENHDYIGRIGSFNINHHKLTEILSLLNIYWNMN